MSPVTPYGDPDKHAAVERMFGRIAARYDLVNRLMTGGLDGRWRREAARMAAVPEGGRVLDVGTGTGDLAMTMATTAPGVQVVGLDYTGPMLALAPAKARRERLGAVTTWVRGDGHRLPFPAETFDAVTSAFVLRNFADLPRAFDEMARVTRPGGRVVALEISPVEQPVWRELFELYFQKVVPRLGGWLSGDPGAYSYLPASAAAFLKPEQIADRLADAGLTPLPHRALMLGTVAIHVGVKPVPLPAKVA